MLFKTFLNHFFEDIKSKFLVVLIKSCLLLFQSQFFSEFETILSKMRFDGFPEIVTVFDTVISLNFVFVPIALFFYF